MAEAATGGGTGRPVLPPREATLAETIQALEGRGYAGQFGARDVGQVICFSCHAVLPANDVALHEATRIEGVSDPADEMVVAALRCPRCAALGTAVFSYGPAAPSADAEAFGLLRDERGQHER